MTRSAGDSGDDVSQPGPSPGRVPHIALRVPAVIENVPVVRHTVVAFAAAHGVDGPGQGAVALAVSEAVSNVVLHAYEELGGGDVIVEADVEGGDLEVVVADEGRGIGGAAPHKGLGLGLAMISAQADELTVSRREPAGTEVWMRFRVSD